MRGDSHSSPARCLLLQWEVGWQRQYRRDVLHRTMASRSKIWRERRDSTLLRDRQRTYRRWGCLSLEPSVHGSQHEEGPTEDIIEHDRWKEIYTQG
jgi:hypothetical protein